MNKKKALMTASILSCAFAAATYLEVTGYAPFDRENGENLLCKIDPTCRHLLPGEIKMAQKYFGFSIDYNKTKIFNRAVMGLFGHETAGMAPNGNIYFADKEDRSRDFANNQTYIQKNLIHELTHVAQHHSGKNVPLEALLTYLTYEFKYNEAYDYRIETGAPFFFMNLEQQAKVMEDYFLKRSEFENWTTYSSDSGKKYRFVMRGDKWLKTQCQELAQYEQKIKQTFPVKPDELCQPKSTAPQP